MKYQFLTSLKAFTLSILLFASANAVSAQDKDWRPVTPAELAAKTPSVEPDADAEATFWEVRIDDSSSDDISRRHYVRVKIYTERGREKFSKFDIPFTKGTKIKDIAARVIKADGSIVEIKKDDIFEREIVKANGIKIKAKSFAIPNIDPGVIVEYRYKETTEDSGAIGMRLQFQRDIPVQTLSYYYKPYRGEPSFQTYNFNDTKFVKDRDGYFLAQRRNVAALKSEPHMPPEDTVRPWMLLTGVRLGSVRQTGFNIEFTLKIPSSPAVYWGAVSTEWSGLTKLMQKPSDEVKKATAQAIAGAVTPDEKLRKIYEYCQTQILNTTFDQSITPEQREKYAKDIKSVNDVVKKKAGSIVFIDLLFGAMATAAGLESRVALLSDRSEILFSPDMMNDAFVAPGGVGVLVGQRWQIFNPGSKYAPYGMLPWKEEGGWVMVVGEKEFQWQKLPFTEHARSKKVRAAKFAINSEGTLEGDVTMEYFGHHALTYRLDNFDESAASRETNFKNDITGQISTAEVSAISIENFDDSSKPLVFKYKVKVPNYAQKTGRRLFIQPGFFEHGRSAVFSSSTRQYDIVFQHPWSESDRIEIAWPEGYALDNATTPAPINDRLQISSHSTAIKADPNSRTLFYNRDFYFGGGNNVLFDPGNYAVLKSLFDQFHSADSHVITLRQGE